MTVQSYQKEEGGSYILKDTVGCAIPYRYHPSYLVPVPFYEPEEGEHLEVKRILAHKGEGKDTLFIVQWKDKSVSNTAMGNRGWDIKVVAADLAL